MQETRAWSLGGENPLEEDMATHSSIFAWRMPWTEDPDGLWSTGSPRVRHNWSNLAHTHTCIVRNGSPQHSCWNWGIREGQAEQQKPEVRSFRWGSRTFYTERSRKPSQELGDLGVNTPSPQVPSGLHPLSASLCLFSNVTSSSEHPTQNTGEKKHSTSYPFLFPLLLFLHSTSQL